MTEQASGQMPPKRSVLEIAEQLAKILSLVAIPVVLGVGGWVLQSSMSDDKTKQEYVKLAVTIINDPKGDATLRRWAANLLSQTSPVPFTPETINALSSGDQRLPFVPTSDVSATFSPDGRTLITGSSDGKVRMWDAQTGRLLQSLEAPPK
ncbi:MAG: WD40 repeat domain-containing protein [Gammaproteobacteria bacterium]